MLQTPIDEQARIADIDVIRGLALFGVLAMSLFSMLFGAGLCIVLRTRRRSAWARSGVEPGECPAAACSAPVLSSPLRARALVALVAGRCPHRLRAWRLRGAAVSARAVCVGHRKTRWRGWLGAFAPLGRMAFTNYLTQTLVFTTVFYGYGLGLMGQVSALGALVMGIVFYAMQGALSTWWLRRFRYGPFEWLWRSLTYGRLIRSVSVREVEA